MHKFYKHIEFYWFFTILLLQVVVIVLFYRYFDDRPYLFIFTSSFFLGLVFVKMRDIFVRPLEAINRDIQLFRDGKISRMGIYGEHQLFEVLMHFFEAMMNVLAKVRDQYIAGRVLSDDVSHASELQRFMIGQKHVLLGGLELIGDTKAAQQINGDTFDFFEKDHQCYIYVGDATGHGVTSGIVCTMTSALIEAYGHTLVEGDRVLTEVNNLLYPRLHGGRIMTLALLRWEIATGQLLLTGAGHEHLLVWRHELQTVEVYPAEGIALGMKRDISSHVRERTIPFGEHDVFVLYSDGITEARRVSDRSKEIFGLGRLKKSIETANAKSAVHVFATITREVASFLGSDFIQGDDMTLICGSVNRAGAREHMPNVFIGDGYWNWGKP